MYLVTGANGFVGRTLCFRLRERRFPYIAAVRVADDHHQVAVGDVGGHTDWAAALDGVSAIIHLASRVHIQGEDSYAAMREVNIEGSRRLAQEAVKAGVRRLIYVSSIKVNGDETGRAGLPDRFKVDHPPNPFGAYAVTKYEAEEAIREVTEGTGVEYVIVRPPLVYGRGAQANFARLVKLVGAGIPLPFGSVENSRSLISVENLADFLLTCAEHPDAKGRTFLVSDDEDVSTPELIRLIALSLGGTPRLLNVPVPILERLARAGGLNEQVLRLTRSLRVDVSDARQVLGWSPRVSLDEGIMNAVVRR